ncbi:hypothetical protein, partial [Mesorhizobium sp. RMAD-H1]|uniref:hypothetical protein n=1 Tax=Mesorhizobium sp. RMAD-H1 TaxID=2587065 RepID=UPI001AED7504
PIDQTLIRKPYSEVAHFSVEKPAQFRVETNTTMASGTISVPSEKHSRLRGAMRCSARCDRIGMM